MYSAAHYDNNRRLPASGAAERASFHANPIYSPFPKLDASAKLIYGQRFLEDDREATRPGCTPTSNTASNPRGDTDEHSR